MSNSADTTCTSTSTCAVFYIVKCCIRNNFCCSVHSDKHTVESAPYGKPEIQACIQSQRLHGHAKKVERGAQVSPTPISMKRSTDLLLTSRRPSYFASCNRRLVFFDKVKL